MIVCSTSDGAFIYSVNERETDVLNITNNFVLSQKHSKIRLLMEYIPMNDGDRSVYFA